MLADGISVSFFCLVCSFDLFFRVLRVSLLCFHAGYRKIWVSRCSVARYFWFVCLSWAVVYLEFFEYFVGVLFCVSIIEFIVWKDSSVKWFVMRWVRYETLLPLTALVKATLYKVHCYYCSDRITSCTWLITTIQPFMSSPVHHLAQSDIVYSAWHWMQSRRQRCIFMQVSVAEVSK